jgi:predicted DNA-binding transcriptional regulator AlpA
MAKFNHSEHLNAEEKLLRLPQVLQLIPVSRSHWYAGIAEGRYPPPIKLSKRVACWKFTDIHVLMASI